MDELEKLKARAARSDAYLLLGRLVKTILLMHGKIIIEHGSGDRWYARTEGCWCNIDQSKLSVGAPEEGDGETIEEAVDRLDNRNDDFKQYLPEGIARKQHMWNLNKVLDDVTRERKVQDEQWGGPNHDDTHDVADWLRYIHYQWSRVSQGFQPRQTLIKIAALAIAAVESMDRNEASEIIETT